MRPVLLTALVLLEVPLGALTTILQLKEERERERGGGECVRKERETVCFAAVVVCGAALFSHAEQLTCTTAMIILT